jgi:serine/threonine-protein kinase
MTPDYASPEQARGIPVNTTSDVYQLGVLLYQLVAGRRPYNLRDRGTAEVIRIICEVDPEKPSVAVRRLDRDESAVEPAGESGHPDLERLSRMLVGDLDTMVLKAMHKDPGRRYASAEALGDDVSRHLEGRPVLARPDTVRYRIGKFVRRNRLGVGVAAVFVALLIGFGAVTAWQARAIALERDAARAERDKAEQVVQILVDLFETSDPTIVPGGDTLRVGSFLERGESQMFEALADQPDLQARMKHVVGKMYAARSQFDRARMLFEEAAAEQMALGGPNHPDVLQTFHDLAVLARRTDRPEAETLLRESLTRQRQRYGLRHEKVAQALDDLSIVVQDEQERADLLEEALSIRREVLPPVSDGIASSLHNLAALRYSQKDFDEATRLWQEALDMLLQLHEEGNPRVQTVLQSLAVVYGSQGRLVEAEALRRRALALARDVIGPKTFAVAVNLSNLGVLLTRKGDFAEAESSFREALSVWRSIFPDDHWRTANDLRNLGIILQYQGRADEGLPYLGEAVAMNRRLHGTDSPQAGYVLGQYGILLLHLGRTEEAHVEVRTALRLVENSSAAGARSVVADTRFRLGHVLLETGALDQAEPLFREVLSTRRNLFPASHPRIDEAKCGLGVVLAEGDDPASGVTLLRDALPRYSSWGQADRLLLARAERALGNLAKK